MANRTRNCRMVLDVSDEEKAVILKNMEAAECVNFGQYARKMLVNGHVLHVDYTEIKELSAQVGRVGNNINQIAKRMNETRNVYPQDVEEIKKRQDEIWQLLRSMLSKLP